MAALNLSALIASLLSALNAKFFADKSPPAPPQISSIGLYGSGVTASGNAVTANGTAEANSTVRIYDGGSLIGSVIANSKGEWSFTSGALSDRTHALTAVAVDAAGNASKPSAASAITIDTTAPVAPIISAATTPLAAAGDATNKVVLSGSAESGSTVKLYDGTTLLGTTTADAKGAWSFTSIALQDGSHAFTAIAMDAAGNASKNSAAVARTIDTLAPAVPTIDRTTSTKGDIGSQPTSANQLTFTGSAEAGSTVKLYDGAVLVGTVIANAKGLWTFASGLLPDGTHKFSTIAVDAAGNASKQSSLTIVTVDTHAPDASNFVMVSPDTGVTGDRITSANSLSFSGTAEAGSTVKFYDGTSLLGSATADIKGVWTLTTAALSDGTHNFSAAATDIAGNIGRHSADAAITIDTQGPAEPTIVSSTPDTGVSGDRITSVNVLSFTGTAEAGSVVKLYDGDVLIGSVKTNSKGAWTFSTGTVADGPHTVSAVAVDAAGNTGKRSAPIEVVVDTRAPTSPTLAVTSADTSIAGDHLTSVNKLSLAGSAEAGSTIKILDGVAVLGSSIVDAGGNWTFTSNALADGEHYLTAVASDAAGNTSNASSGFDFTVDTKAPLAPYIEKAAADSLSGHITTADSFTFIGSAETYSTVQLFDGKTLIGSATADSAGAWSYDSSTLAPGEHSITAIAVDRAGNTSLVSAPFDFTVDPPKTADVKPGEIGINLSGAEASVYLGNTYVHGVTYTYPTTENLDYFQSKGIALVRLPISWEAMEPTLNGQLDPAELNRLTVFLADAAAHGMKVIVDLHNFGRYYNETIGSKDVPITAFQDFWTKLADVLKDNPAVVGYDIMNEPHDMGGSDIWPKAAQAAVNGIRSVDQNTTIYVEGDGWSTASTWLQYNANLHITDPSNKLVYEAHQYFGLNPDGSFKDYAASDAYPTMGADLIQPFVQWLQQNNASGYMGEFAVRDDDPRWMPVLDNFIKALQSYGIPGTYWSAGSGTEYLNFSVQPLNGEDRPQLSLLTQYADGTGTANDGPIDPELHTFKGTAGNDYIAGYSGSNTLSGGGGQDVFVVYDSGVKIVQTTGANDSGVVQAYANYVLPSQSNVNTLLLYGTADHATANDTGSTLVANDTLGSVLTGGKGNDTLVGGQHTAQGLDVLIGGGGSDMFVIYNSSTAASQTAGANNSGTVIAYADYTLGQNSNIQTLTLNGSATHATANDQGATLIGHDTLASVLTGGKGNDTLVGGQHVANGYNTMMGGGGNDTFIIYNSADKVSQLAGAGNSGTVVAYADYALPQGGNIDTLMLKGTASHATASDAGSTLIANASVASVLSGGHGNDILVSGASSDAFVFGTNFGKDVITNFTSSGSVADKILFDTASFANWDVLQKSITESAHGDAIITAVNGDTVTLMGVHAADLHQQNFQFMHGGLLV